jgi:TRAP-type mannitol/chloroaromatic compound transport system permease small subunit
MLILEVFLRYAIGRPTVWTNELAQYLFGAYVMLSGAYLLSHKGHASVDIIYGRFPRRVQAGISILTSFLFFVFVYVLVTEGASIALQAVEELEHSGTAWNAPIWPVKLTIPIGSALLFVQGVSDLIESLEIFFGLDDKV